jgi:TDG/mug DNA glycosylase family protein
VLPDILVPFLRVVFCRTAAGPASARAKVYYAGPGNRFWATLEETGLTPERLEPAEFRRLLGFGIGLTDICKVLHRSGRRVLP